MAELGRDTDCKDVTSAVRPLEMLLLGYVPNGGVWKNVASPYAGRIWWALIPPVHGSRNLFRSTAAIHKAGMSQVVLQEGSRRTPRAYVGCRLHRDFCHVEG